MDNYKIIKSENGQLTKVGTAIAVTEKLLAIEMPKTVDKDFASTKNDAKELTKNKLTDLQKKCLLIKLSKQTPLQ